MPYVTAGGSGGGITYVVSTALGGPGLPDPASVSERQTYGRLDAIDMVSLWRVTTRIIATISRFTDSRGFYHGDHSSNPSSAGSSYEEYYFNDQFEHFRGSNSANTVPQTFFWSNLPITDFGGVTRSSINQYLPTNHTWINGDGTVSGEGVFNTDISALEYLNSEMIDASENYVFFNRSLDELRSISGTGFVDSTPRWEAVSSGTGGVPGARGSNGTDGSDGVDGTDGSNGVNGNDGADGNQGPQGVYVIQIFRNLNILPDTPTGGSFGVTSGILVPPANWTVSPTTPSTGDNTYISQDTINPAVQSGDIIPSWGMPFEAGAHGPQGATGPRGAQGVHGPAGAQGIQGAPGADGPTGAAGENGARGAQGSIGSQGPQGDAGEDGRDGASGLDGQDGSAGDQGVQGIFIIQVYRNAANIPSTPTGGSYNLVTGVLTAPSNWTVDLDPVPGNQARFISQDTINPALQTGTVTPTWSDPFSGGGVGPQGPIGPQGNTGSQGTIGSQGPQGDTGSTGAAGQDGVDGQDGVQGPQGDQGSAGAQGGQGPIGPQGDQGPRGDTGSQGLEGPQGAQGIQGRQGDDGSQGDVGNTGSTGSAGPTGVQGELGPYVVTIYRSATLHPNTPPIGGMVVVDTGVVTPPTGWTNLAPNPGIGEFLYGTQYRVDPVTQSGSIVPTWSTVYLFSGPRGSRGDDGPTGPTGTAGVIGQDGDQGPQGQYDVTVYQNASSAPAIPTGGSVNVETGVVVAPTGWTVNPTAPITGENTYATRITVNPSTQTGIITPSWSAVFEAGGAGPAGPQGIQGNPGTDGADGAQGGQGEQGDQGIQGIQGIQGQAGTDGNPGATGLDGSDGDQGLYTITIYRNADTQPSSPVGGTVIVDTGVVTPPSNWGNTPINPSAGQVVWASQSRINPAFDIGTHIPTWLGVFQFSGQVGAQNLDDVITTGLIREYNIAATATGTNTGTQNEFAGSIFEVGDEDLHVHRAGGRVNNVSSRSGYRVVLFSAQEISSTNHQIQDNTHADYFYHRSSSRSVSSGQQYVEAGFDQIIPANSFFGVAVTHSSGVRPTFGDDSEIDIVPGSASFSWVSAALSEDSSESDLDGQNLQPSLVGAYTTRVEFSTAVAVKFSSSFTYTVDDGIYELDVNTTSTGGVTSLVAGEGLVGNTTTGDVTLDIDETATDFPVIPIDKGGTGADTASEAITNLGADQAFIGASWIGLDRELVFNRLGGGTPDTVPITISGFRGVSGDSFISSVTFHFGDYCVIGNLLYVYTERVTTNFTSSEVEASSDFVSLPILDSNGDVLEDQIPPEIARLISPALTGTPTAPTPSSGDNDTSIATTAFVQGELQDLVRDVIESGGVVTVTKEDGTTSTFNLSAGGGGGLTQDQVDARVRVGVYDWAEEGNTDDLPSSKMPDATDSDVGAVRGSTTDEIDDQNPSGTIFGWSIDHFRRLVHLLVPSWAQTGNSDDVPVSKIPSEIARLDAPVFTGDSQAGTPTAGDNDTSIATTAFVQGELQDLVRDVIESSGTVTVTKEDGTTNTFSLGTGGGDGVAVETLFDNTPTTETAFTTGTGNGWNSAVDVILSRVLVTDDDALDLRGRFEYTRNTSRRSIDFTMNAGVFRNFGDTSALTGTTQATEGYHMFLLQDARASGSNVGNTFTRLGIATRSRTSGGEEVLRLLMNVTGNAVGAVSDMRGVVELVPVGGAQGVQGQYTVTIYRNATSTPAQPTGGSVDVSTGVVTPPIDWSISPATPSSGENTYASSATVNPNSQSGSITPTWSAVFTAGGTGPPGPQGEQGEQGLQGDDGAVGTAVTANPSGTDGDDLERVDIGGTNYNISGLGTRYYLTNPALSTSGLYSVSIPGILDTRTGDIVDMPIAGTTLVTDQTTGVRLQVNSSTVTNVTHADGSSVTFEDLRVIPNLRWQMRRTGAVHIVEGFDLFEFVGRTATTVADDDSFVFGDVSEAGEPPVRIESVDLFDQIRPSAQSDGTNVQTSPTAYDFRGTGVTVEDISGVARITINAGTAPHPGTHNRYVGWSGDRTIEDADFIGLVADTDDEITIPARITNGYVWFGIEESVGYPDSAIISGNSQNQITAFEQLTGTVPFGGDNYVIGVSHQLLSSNIAGRTITFGYN